MSTVERTSILPGTLGPDESAHGMPAASWPAIFAGAFVAISASLILLTLGAGLGFAAVSPWSDRGISAATFTVTTAIWLIFTQWISAGLGGYIAGRLRTRWIGVHGHEIFFRDTAHGLVTWAVATVFVTTTLLGALGSGLHTASDVAAAGVHGAASASAGAMAGGPPPAGGDGPMGPRSSMSMYNIDKLFRATPTASAMPAANAGSGPGAPMGPGAPIGGGMGDARAEAGRIVANSISTGSVSEDDRAYLAQVVAARTGVSPADAQKRVDDFVSTAMQAEAKAKADADEARKAAAQASIYAALSLLVGAFIASVSAALGGRLRDEHL